MNICKGVGWTLKCQEQTLYLMIISKLLLASKGIPVLLGFDDSTDFASKHRKKYEQQRECGTDSHRTMQSKWNFPWSTWSREVQRNEKASTPLSKLVQSSPRQGLHHPPELILVMSSHSYKFYVTVISFKLKNNS